jgi:alkylated DNA repair dioxygenase AlkB
VSGASQSWPLPDADVRLYPDWLDGGEADRLLAQLVDEIAWEQHRVRLFGRELPAPRLSCWIGDAGASYTYSRVRFEPRPWTPALALLRERVSAHCGERFNSVLANLYRGGRDAMGWHSDDEPELGPRPLIASVSLGAQRRFRLRDRRERRRSVGIDLPHGSLLVMAGETQRYYQHALPRTRVEVGARLNLTFRRIVGV